MYGEKEECTVYPSYTQSKVISYSFR